MKFYMLLATCLLNLNAASAFTITGKYCKRNVSVKYQEPVLRRRDAQTADLGVVDAGGNKTGFDAAATVNKAESSIIYEPRVRWEITNVCCPGYSPLLFGFCEPLCDAACPRFSYCAAPNECRCLPGYEAHHPNNKKLKLLDCRPVCADGCPPHSRCVARNRCYCRAGFRNTSKWWFLPPKCERIKCAAPDQRYDVAQRLCVKIEMTMEELMREVAERLTKGLSDTTAEDYAEQSSDEVEASAEEDNEIVTDINL